MSWRWPREAARSLTLSDVAAARCEPYFESARSPLNPPSSQPLELEAVVLKARLKASLLGREERVRLGRFELLRSCGRGGEGVVYEALDTSSGARVALKHLHNAHALAGATLQREFRAMSRIVHPHLALLYELFRVDAQWFYTMELLSGADFVSATRGGERALRTALIQLLQGLSALHAAGAIHRDLKPSNVLVEPGRGVVILDYGLVVSGRGADAGARAERPAGTRAYMAPEQADGDALTPAADLYAVGALLYRALTDALPPLGKATSVGARPSWVMRDIPADLDALCADLLQRDPAARPSAAQALLRLTRRAPDPRVPASVSTRAAACFVGRSAELDALRGAFAHTLRGEPAIALVHGESGIGKSALLGELRRELLDSTRALVLSGRCYEREETPYKVFDSVISALVQRVRELPEPQMHGLEPEGIAALQRVFPAFAALRSATLSPQRELALKDPKALRQQAFAALRVLLCRVRRGRPLVLIVDDLQWGDADSVRLLQHVLSPPEAPALLFVGAYRRGEHDTSPFLQRALEEGALGCPVRAVALDALSEADALHLTRAAPGGAGRSLQQLQASVRAARGVPFVLLELIAHAGGAALAAHSLNDVLAARAARCSPAARALLDVLCIAGRPLELELAAWTTRADAAPAPAVRDARADTYAAAAELCAAGLTRWRDTSRERCLEPYHDLIRRAFAARASAARARRVHGELARGMEALALEQPEQLFQHLLASGDRERAGSAAVAAAQRASHALAWLRAADWYGAALEHLPQAEAHARQVHERLGEVLAYAGRHRAAAQAFLRGVKPGAADGSRLERHAAQQLLRAGDHAAGTALVSKLLRQVGLRYPTHRPLAIAQYCAAQLALLSGVGEADPRRTRDPASVERLETLGAFFSEYWLFDPLRALLFQGWLMREARRATDGYWLIAQLWEVVQRALADGPAATARCEELLANVDRLRAPSGIVLDAETLAYARSVYLIHCRAQPRDALVLLREAERVMTEGAPGSHIELGWLALLKDYALELTGGFSELVEGVLQRERDYLGRDDGYSLQLLLISLPLAHLIQDEPQAALDFLRTHWVRSQRGITLTDFVTIMRVTSVLVYQGDAQAAHVSLLDEWGRLLRSGAFGSRVVRENASFHRARNAAALYCETGRPALKREVQHQAARVERSPPTIRAPFRLVHASIARADGRIADCRAWLEAARADFLTSQCDAGAMIASYRLAQLDRSPAALAAARNRLLARGVRNVEPWVRVSSPGPAQW